MLVNSLKTLTQAPSGWNTAGRTRFRDRTFATASLNRPGVVPEEIGVTTIDGARLRAQVYGPADGETLVLIHGWSCSLEYWYPQINAFATQYRVVCYDQRGHGESQWGTAGPSAATMADDLSAVLDATLPLGQRAVLVGHSMGGITLQAWAARYPEQVTRRARGVLLVNTTSGNIRYDTDLLPWLNKPVTLGEQPLTVFGAPVRLPLLIAETLLTAPVPIPGGWPARAALRARIMSPRATDDQVEFALGMVRACRPWVRGRFAALLADLELADAATYLRVPTTVIAGSRDHLLPERMSRIIANSLAATGHLAGYHVWPTGHLGTVEAAEKFNAELARVLQGAHTTTAMAG